MGRFDVSVLLGTDKKKEVFIKYKRLKQMMSNGKNYTDFISEQKKYTINSNSSRLVNQPKTIQDDQQDMMKKMEIILRYVKTKQIDERNDNLLFMELSDDRNSSVDNNTSGNPSPNAMRKQVFLPDCSVYENRRWFYSKLKHLNNLQILGMPNIQEYNTKRYEKIWLDYMRSLNLSDCRLIIAHGTSAEAMLRYLESDLLKHVERILLIDCTDLYTAGERHGREFRYNYYSNHSFYSNMNIDILSTSSMFETECSKVHQKMIENGISSQLFHYSNNSNEPIIQNQLFFGIQIS